MTSLVARMTTVSDATACSVTCDGHSDNGNIFIIQATDFLLEKYSAMILSMMTFNIIMENMTLKINEALC